MRRANPETPEYFIADPVRNGSVYECGVFPSFVEDPRTGNMRSIINAEIPQLYSKWRDYAVFMAEEYNSISAMDSALEYLDSIQ